MDGGSVKIIAVPKPDGRCRSISKYSPIDRARQIRVRLAWGPMVTFDQSQAGVPGRGMHDLIARVPEAVRSGRFRYAIEVDVADFFLSINSDILRRQWGIPASVVQQILTNERKAKRGQIHPGNNLARKHWKDIHTRATQSLPQGSLASPIFAYGLLQSVCNDFLVRHGREVQLFNYCDNFLILAPNRRAMQAAIESLTTMLLKHPAAEFSLNSRTGIRRLADGVDFLGYRIVKRPSQPIVRLSPATKRRFRSAFEQRMIEIENPPSELVCSREDRIANLAEWAARFVLSRPGAAHEYLALTRYVARRLKSFSSNEKVRDAMNRLVKKMPTEEDLTSNKMGSSARSQRRARRPEERLVGELLSVPRAYRLAGSYSSRSGHQPANLGR
jgi:hypothetical protein